MTHIHINTTHPYKLAQYFKYYILQLRPTGPAQFCCMYKVLNGCDGTNLNMKMAVFWDVAVCHLVGFDQHFKGASCLHQHGCQYLLVSMMPHPKRHLLSHSASYKPQVSLKF